MHVFRLNILTLTGKPMITYDDKLKAPQRVKAGSTLSVTVNISGTPAPKVSWFLADELLSSSNGTNIETRDTYSKVTFKGITAKSAGRLTVKAENKAGSDSAEFKVEIKGQSEDIIC